MKSLDEIMLSYRTDKASLYHNYTPVYESYFEPLRDKKIVLLELGIGDIHSDNREGESILGWREYFYNGTCCAIDNDIHKITSDNTFLCDQTNEVKLKSIVKIIGNPDIIIDDASHIQSNTIKSFEILFPYLSKGGLYCIEDCVTAFWPSWEGNDVISYDNESIFINMAYETIFTYMFQLVYYVNLKRQETFNPPQSINIPDWIKEIDSIHFHHSQIIIKKK